MKAKSNESVGIPRLSFFGGCLGFMVLIGLGLWWMAPPITPQPDLEGKEVAMVFLDLLRQGKSAEAWQGSSAEFKSFMGRETLLTLAHKTPALREKPEFVSMEKAKVNGLDRTIFTFRTPKAMKKIQVTLAPEQGTFRIEHFVVE
ncbi:MAG: hypothetical protein EXS11_05695 [Gemmataceae bacterium]|nr:hypothetical protein [Gemmataceae bacterium]